MDVQGVVTVPEFLVDSATQKTVELQITQSHCVNKATSAMPVLMEDACRPEFGKETDVGSYTGKEEDKVAAHGLVRVIQKVRLDNRWIDLRTPANQAIFRIESMVGCILREFLISKGFVEIHTSRLRDGPHLQVQEITDQASSL